MSAPQNQPPYQPPYQPQYQAAPPYGQQRPRRNHVGKLVVAIILFVIGPLMGLFIWGIGSVITCLLYTSPSPRDVEESRMPSSA